MTINFIPNDPKAGPRAPKLRTISPRPDRASTASSFNYSGAAAEAQYPPGTSEFLYWQCREAALATLEAWEATAGTHTRWQAGQKIALLQNAGEDMNAYYDRASFSFFQAAAGNRTFFSGASTDVVAHEVGHGLLDALRPDLWDSTYLEVSAFHEAFGDCVAILTALDDSESRQKLLEIAPDLRKRNFVESTAEELADGIRRIQSSHNAAEPRRAYNMLKYQLPTTLPNSGGPGVLINESHSFGMLFTGCFWDLIANLFAGAGTQTSTTLLDASRKAGTLLVAATRVATHSPRFLQAVGQAMVLADGQANSGANHQHIRDAFHAHDILLGSNAAVAPTMALAGSAPKKGVLQPDTRKTLAALLDLPKGQRLGLRELDFFGTPAVETTHEREIPLAGIDKRLRGVVAIATEAAKVGSSGMRAAVLGLLPNKSDTEAEVESYVTSLLRHGKIDFGNSTMPKGGMVADLQSRRTTTHVIAEKDGKRVLTRVRFQCTPGT